VNHGMFIVPSNSVLYTSFYFSWSFYCNYVTVICLLAIYVSTLCKRKVLFEQKKIKLLNKVSFEENITEIRQHVLKNTVHVPVA